jgi:ATP-dependent DNA helicase RecG
MTLHRYRAFDSKELGQRIVEGGGARLVLLPAKSTPRTVAENLAALANSSGGIVVLGVTAAGTVQKGADVNALYDVIAQSCLLTDPPIILPSAQIVPLGAGGENLVVVVETPAGLPNVYSVQGIYWTRQDAQNRPLTTSELRRLLLERGERSFESHPVPNATLDDFDAALIERYSERIAAPPDGDRFELLQIRGCIAEGEDRQPHPTIAGLLIFGRQPQRFLRSAEIICVRYAGTSMSDEFVRQDINGVLIEQIRQAEAFVTSNMRRGMRITGMQRQESGEYPLAVVREAIVNAVAHRDYSIRGEGIRLLMFSDRLEVYSPGRLPGHVTLENLKDERYSRNEAIVALLSDYGYIERLGYGIDRMLAAMNEAGLPEPKFEQTSAGFRVTLQSAGQDLVSSQPAQQPWSHTFLNERQEQAMAFVRQQGRITNSDLQELCPAVSAETLRRDLADLVERNLLIRIGAKKATYYILK